MLRAYVTAGKDTQWVEPRGLGKGKLNDRKIEFVPKKDIKNSLEKNEVSGVSSNISIGRR